MLNRDFYYSDEQPVRVYSPPIAADSHTPDLFRRHQEQFTFYNNSSSPIGANKNTHRIRTVIYIHRAGHKYLA